MRLQPNALLSLMITGGMAVSGMARGAAPAEIKLPGERIFPESMTSTADGSLIIGSIGAKTIYRVKPGSDTAEAWIQPGTDGLSSVFGVLADARSKTLWACSSVFGTPGAAPTAPTTLYAFDLKSGATKGQYPFPTPGGFCNDIAIGPDGTAYATDTNNMEIVSLKKGATALQVWAGDGAFGPKGGVLDGISVLDRRVVVNTLLTNKLFSVPIDAKGSSGKVTEVQLDRAIDHPDGMRTFGHEGVLVVEGGGGGRLSKIALRGDTGKVTTIKEGYPDGPVAVTVVGTTGYVLEGQLMALRAGADAALKPFHATSVEVGKP